MKLVPPGPFWGTGPGRSAASVLLLVLLMQPVGAPGYAQTGPTKGVPARPLDSGKADPLGEVREQAESPISGLGAIELQVPLPENSPPRAGARVIVRPPEFAETEIYHTLYLPSDWSMDAVADGRRWPVIVEYTGNYFPCAGSTGRVDDARLGYGLSGGRCIWLVLPMVDLKNRCNASTWWGDPEATARYARTEVERVCRELGGDERRVVLCGFSRGAIGCSFIGLGDPQTARLWCAIVTHDHFDGVKAWRGTDWGTPLDSYRAGATERLRRLGHRPLLVCQNGSVAATREFLESVVNSDQIEFLEVDTVQILGAFPNRIAVHPHTDGWLLVPSPYRKRAWEWMDRVLFSPR